MIINGEKMSKSTGNFLTLRDCIDKFGVDATRVTLADAGDGLEDANFETDVANASILKLFTFEKWIQDQIKSAIPDGQIDFAPHKTGDLWDNIFENAINHGIDEATNHFDGMRYKQVFKYGFYELQSIKEDYLIAKSHKANPFTLMRYIVA
jgi:leucyl-tRNA synthetase